ncbi:MAG: MFS transporter [Peptococcaceae bacterium]|nr:MFS transporter [Peptococcaceae bacterium]
MSEQVKVKNPWIAYLGFLFGSFTIIEALAFQIPVVPVVTKVFGISVASAAFIGLVYYLTHIVAGPVWGNLADQFGRKKIVLLGVAIFAVSEFMAAVSPNFEFFLFARSVQGIGSGCVVSSGLAYAQYLFPPEKRGAALGTFSSIGTVGAAVGGIVGGNVVNSFGWQYIYYINCTFAIIGFIIISLTVPETESLGKKPFDYLGSLLLLLTVGTLLGSTTLMSNLGVTSPTTLGVLAAGFILFLIFWFYEKKNPHPFLELSLLKNKIFILPLILYFLIQVCNTGAMMANSFYVNVKPGGGPVAVGTVAMWSYITGALGGFISGRLIDRFRIKHILLVGITVFFIGIFAYSRFTPETPTWYISAAIGIFTAGICMMMPACIKMALSVVPADKLGSGSGTYTMIQYMGNPAGNSIGLAIFSSLSSSAIATQLTAKAQVHGVGQDMIPAILEAGKTKGAVVAPALADYLAKIGLKFQTLYTEANVQAMVSALNSMAYIILGITVCVFLLAIFALPNIASTYKKTSSNDSSDKITN